MGYYGDFGFNFIIPADKVEAAEAKLREVALEECLITEEEAEGSFADIWDVMWDDCDSAFEDSPSPLEALANGCARGQISVQGGVHKKWRSWEEPLFDSLGEFAVGEISVKGEDCDTPTTWSYAGDGEWRLVDYQLVDIEACRQYEKAVQLLQQIREGSSDISALQFEIDQVLAAVSELKVA